VKRILLIQGHPDKDERHLCHALEDAYTEGARAAGHDVRRVDVATLDFPLLRSQYEWENGALPLVLRDAHTLVKWAEHYVFFFPLWLGDLPAQLKGFLEHVSRPGGKQAGGNGHSTKGLEGRSARVVVTMGMHSSTHHHHWFFLGNGAKSVGRDILEFMGIHPVHDTVIGDAGDMTNAKAEEWFEKLRKLGEQGD